MDVDFKNWLIIKESRRRFCQHKLLSESYQPQTGIYWWIPMPKGDKDFDWDIIKFFDSEYGEVLHETMWKKEVSSFLITAWKERASFDLKKMVDFKNSYAGLPRGRVTKGMNNYLILHGNDSPAQNIKSVIVREFGLPNDLTKEMLDDHERILQSEKKVIESILGIQF